MYMHINAWMEMLSPLIIFLCFLFPFAYAHTKPHPTYTHTHIKRMCIYRHMHAHTDIQYIRFMESALLNINLHCNA